MTLAEGNILVDDVRHVDEVPEGADPEAAVRRFLHMAEIAIDPTLHHISASECSGNVRRYIERVNADDFEHLLLERVLNVGLGRYFRELGYECERNALREAVRSHIQELLPRLRARLHAANDEPAPE
jgi:hypothetical protein